MEQRTGGCLCGAVTFTARLESLSFGACHCDQCRHWAGGPLMAITVAADGMAVAGAENLRVYTSSDWAERASCAVCGASLWYRVTLAEGPMAGTYHLAVGTLDDMTGLTLRRELFADRTAGAYAFAGDHRRLSAAETVAMFTGGAA